MLWNFYKGLQTRVSRDVNQKEEKTTAITIAPSEKY